VLTGFRSVAEIYLNGSLIVSFFPVNPDIRQWHIWDGGEAKGHSSPLPFGI